ncbi:MAG: hypothetical protein U0822_15780 [Anaerolineae bacterium]
MSDNKNEQVVIALFDNQQFADFGIDHLKQWDRANDEIKLGVIGTITKHGDKVKTHVDGSLFNRSLHLTKEQIDALGEELDRGKVAVVVTCDENEVEPLKEQLARWGADVKGYGVPTEAFAEAAAAIPEHPDAAAAPAAADAPSAEATAPAGEADKPA